MTSSAALHPDPNPLYATPRTTLTSRKRSLSSLSLSLSAFSSLLIVLFFRIEIWQGGVKFEHDKLVIIIMCVQRLFQTSLLVRVSGLKNIINALRFPPFLITHTFTQSFLLTRI